jgi:GNAT superfamily N-acetyltransferase
VRGRAPSKRSDEAIGPPRRSRRMGMDGQVFELRRVHGEHDLQSARALAKEYGHWAAQVAKAEYGIDAKAETEQGLSTSIDELLRPRARLYVAYVDGVDVGIGGLKPVSHEVAEIKRMYVRPSARGRGVGRALMMKLLDDVRELDFRIVRLESAAFMTASHELYRSVGFVDVPPFERSEFGAIPGATDIQVFMQLELDAPSAPS